MNDDQGVWDGAPTGAHGKRTVAAPDPTANLYGPLEQADPGRLYVIAHLAQSLDGCVALENGESQWISGKEDVVHTHELRARVDAVIVGVQTVLSDDPRLTVRHCEGSNPVRVVLDPSGRAAGAFHVLTDGHPTWFVREKALRPDDIEVPLTDGVFDPEHILAALWERGIRKVLVEGGGVTVSHFLSAGCVDRLHLVVAPVLLGGGRRAFPLPLVEQLANARRLPVRPVPLGVDWLFDCALR